MYVIKPPYPYDVNGKFSIFLAGTIDMGSSVDWQKEFPESIPTPLRENLLILNPRRDDWDSTWEQTIHHPKFRAQVEWELKGLVECNMAVFYFAPDSKSPITLMELGMVASRAKESGQAVLVCCPEGYWRKGNVDIICAMYGIPVLPTMKALKSRVLVHLAMTKALFKD